MRVKAFSVPPQEVQLEILQSPNEMKLYKYTSPTLVTTPMLQLLVHLTIMMYSFQILTKDQAAILVGLTVQFLIINPVAFKSVVQDLNHFMRVLAQTTLVNIMMTQKLIELQNDKKFIGIHAEV